MVFESHLNVIAMVLWWYVYINSLMVFEWYLNGPRGHNGQWCLNGTSMVCVYKQLNDI